MKTLSNEIITELASAYEKLRSSEGHLASTIDKVAKESAGLIRCEAYVEERKVEVERLNAIALAEFVG